LPLLLLVMQGCCFLPVPHPRLHAYGVQGRVVDEDGKPMPNVKVVSPARDIPGGDGIIPKRETVTDTNGFFRLKPDWGWHGAFSCDPMNGFYSTFPDFAYTFRKRTLQHRNNLHFIADEFPAQTATLDYWYGKANKVEGNYIHSKDITLYQRTTANYLAVVMPKYQAQDILAILFFKAMPKSPTWETLKPVCAITDTNLIQTIISEMSVPAEMATGFRHDDANTLSCMVFLFRNKSSNVMGEARFVAMHGHFIKHDGTVMNCHVGWWDNLSYLRNVTPGTLDSRLTWRWRDQERRPYVEQRRADVTWRFQSKAIADLVRNILSSEHPDFIVKP